MIASPSPVATAPCPPARMRKLGTSIPPSLPPWQGAGGGERGKTPTRASTYKPEPTSGASPTRPGCLNCRAAPRLVSAPRGPAPPLVGRLERHTHGAGQWQWFQGWGERTFQPDVDVAAQRRPALSRRVR